MAADDQADDQVESRKSRSPRVHVDSGPLPTDSMVTVRLSDPVPPNGPMQSQPGAGLHLDIVTEPSQHIVSKVLPETETTHTSPLGNGPSEMEEETDFEQLDSPSDDIIEDHHGEQTPKTQATFHASRDSGITEIAESPMTPYDDSAESGLRSRSNSSGTETSKASVDWAELERTEENEPRDEQSDESTAFLLARLEQENNLLATDPKASIQSSKTVSDEPPAKKTRPPSIHQLKKLVNGPQPASLRYSMLPAPPVMTDLEFYGALVQDYHRTAQCLPTLLSKKIMSGIPPPLRGVVWMSMSGARDKALEERYEILLGESSPYEGMIGKDIGRSFPGVEMFRNADGEGQNMLGRVLRCFSIHDADIGYCQGLGLIVGPLLMHMGEKEAFCVLARLMDQYDLRSCYLPNMYGLHLRIFQFQRLLSQHLPTLSAHLDQLGVDHGYATQWFLSFFAVTCPLPMLFRIYDVIFAEGALETMMRVALSLMRRNESRLLACTEFEDAMQLLLSRELWDTYADDADDLVQDFTGLTGIVTRDGLLELAAAFKETQDEGAAAKAGSSAGLQAAATRFLGRLWAGNASTQNPVVTLSPMPAPSSSRPTSAMMLRTPSKQSVISTMSSSEVFSESGASSATTDATTMSRTSSADTFSLKSNISSTMSATLVARKAGNKDSDLHGQIEELLMAMTSLQKEHARAVLELQKEREEREEERILMKSVIEAVKDERTTRGLSKPVDSEEEAESVCDGTDAKDSERLSDDESEQLAELLTLADEYLSAYPTPKQTASLGTRQQLQDELTRSKEQHQQEMARSEDLSRQLNDREDEITRLKDQIKETRNRVVEGQKEKQRLEKTVTELRSVARKSELAQNGTATPPQDPADQQPSASAGLRELKLGRSDSLRSQPQPQFSPRSSSLNVSLPVTPAEELPTPPAIDDSILIELANAKAAEALARQEAEDAKAKLETLRRVLGMSSNANGGSPSGHKPTASQPTIEKSTTFASLGSYLTAVPARNPDPPAAAAATNATPTAGSKLAGWGTWAKRSVSNSITGLPR